MNNKNTGYPRKRVSWNKMSKLAWDEADSTGIIEVTASGGERTFLVTSYTAVKDLLKDERLSSAANYSHREQIPLPTPPLNLPGKALINTDDMQHRHIKRQQAPFFSPKAAEELREQIELSARRSLTELSTDNNNGYVELIEEYCLPIAARTIMEILGTNNQPNVRRMINWSNTLLDLSADKKEVDLISKDMGEYFQSQIEGREKKKGLIGHLGSNVFSGQLALEDAISQCMEIFIAAHFTTAAMLGFQIATVLTNPELVEPVINEKTTAAVSSELCRIHNLFEVMPFRMAMEDIWYDGNLIPKNSCVIFLLESANKDPKEFPDPHEISIHRNNSKNSLQFSTGKRRCIGFNIASTEIEIALRSLFSYYPQIRLACRESDLEVDETKSVQSLKRLPVYLNKENCELHKAN